MKKVSVLAACVLLAGSALAAEPKTKVVVAQANKVVVAKTATKAVRPVAKTSEAVYDYRLERESCCGPQN